MNFTQIESLRRALAECQHHDSVSGTSRWYVVDIFILITIIFIFIFLHPSILFTSFLHAFILSSSLLSFSLSFLYFLSFFDSFKHMYNDHLNQGEADAYNIAQQSLGSLLNNNQPIKVSNDSYDVQHIQKGQYPIIMID